MKLHNKVTFEQVKEGKSNTIYYSSRTFWWTDDPEDLQKSKPILAHLVPKGMDPATYGTNMPCDIFGAPLFQIEKEKWIGDIARIEGHYGGIPVLMAMHHKNFTPDIGDSIRSFSVKQTFIDAVAKQHAELDIPEQSDNREFPCPECDKGEMKMEGFTQPNGQTNYLCDYCGYYESYP